MKTTHIIIIASVLLLAAVGAVVVSQKKDKEASKVPVLTDETKKTIKTSRKTKLPYIDQDSDLAIWLYENLSEKDLKAIGGMMIYIYKDAHGEQKNYKKDAPFFQNEKEFVRSAAWQVFGQENSKKMEFDGGYMELSYCLDTEI